MSVFAPGTGGTLKSVTNPAALFEAARLLDTNENARNMANTGVSPKNNITVSIDFGTRVASLAASIPAVFTLDASGNIVVNAVDYLGSTFSAVTPGVGGDAKGTDSPSLFVEIAQMLAAKEKLVTPVEDQPNNVQIILEAETQAIVITATLPINTAGDASGAVIVSAVDYLL